MQITSIKSDYTIGNRLNCYTHFIIITSRVSQNVKHLIIRVLKNNFKLQQSADKFHSQYSSADFKNQK